MKIAVLGGGRSPEHDVSLRGAAAVAVGLRELGHEVEQIELHRDGRWTVSGEEISVTPGGGLLGCDAVFPVLHGPGGEDGSVQGLLELLDVPFVGSGVLASAVCLDKIAAKDAMLAAGIPQVDYEALTLERWAAEPEAIIAAAERLAKPWWVKAACGGSSIGMEPVDDAAELPAAIERCFEIDDRVIIEAAATGTEIECAVLGGPPGETLISLPGEIVVMEGEWYDHKAKYTPGGMELRVPATLAPGLAEQVQQLCLRAFAQAGCHGLARVDCFVDTSGEEPVVLLNEINTLPGFTATSVYAQLWEASGTGYQQLLTALIDAAMTRRRRLSND